MLSFSSPILLTIALTLVAVTIAIGRLRTVQLRALTSVLLVCGLVLIAVAAGGPVMHWAQEPKIVVMVDLSSSTRGAAYREVSEFAARTRQLLDRVPSRVVYFADRNVESELPLTQEIPSDQTVFTPPTADAILLFSDGQFELPTWSPPTFAVIDPNLQSASDGRIDWMEIRDKSVAVGVANSGAARELSISAAASPIVIGPGSQVVTADLQLNTDAIRASLDPADRWPENDSTSIYPAPPAQLQRWWVGGSAPDSTWIALDPVNLPTESSRYLNTGVIVLENVPADALPQVQQDRLTQFVRDLGGGLVILGGDRAFAAGGYPGTALEQLSPLSSTAPAPATHWVLLVDSSGSMASVVGESTRWQLASKALLGIIPNIAPNDPVSIGSFARDLRWWSESRTARRLASSPLPPREISPQGPTNLQPALESILAASDGSLPTEILLITDADTKLDVAALGESMRSKRCRAHLLAIAEVTPDNPVHNLVKASGGKRVTEADPTRWPQAVRELLRAASPAHLSADPVEVRFVGPLASLSSATVKRWNHVWPKEQTAALVETNLGQQVLAAEWSLGAGRVVAAAFAPDRAPIDAVVGMVTSEPRDPRFQVTWTTAGDLRISIDAIDDGKYLNELRFALELRQPDDLSRIARTHELTQIAPGRYEFSLRPPRRPAIASVLLDGRPIDRRALAGRYAPEFDGIGINREVLRELASRGGGRVIEPDDLRAVQFKMPERLVELSAVLTATGAVLIAMGLIHWKLR